jgi:N-sulfoglucosamine sulfohydrolase
VFAYWPDVDSVKNDLLDYAYELEYFDTQLGKMLKILEEQGELENTIVVVTSDNGMPFPRIKGQQYEHSHHLPLAIMWPQGIKNPGRKVSDYVSFTDFAPTFFDIAGFSAQKFGMWPMEGKSLRPVFSENSKSKNREFVLLGKERHDVGRPHDWGYPIRGIVQGDFLYLKNFKPDRWPAGNPETGYTNTDGSPTKSFILNLRRNKVDTILWQMNFGKRPEEELYKITEDENCIVNLANVGEYQKVKKRLSRRMQSELKKQGDPRILGKGDIFDKYPAYQQAGFYESYMKGEKVNSGWINKTDFEKQ